MRKIRSSLRSLAMAAGMAISLLTIPAWAVPFAVSNLVTDDPTANPAQITDAGLRNAWGMSYAPTGPFRVSSTGAGTSPLYAVDPATQWIALRCLRVAGCRRRG